MDVAHRGIRALARVGTCGLAAVALLGAPSTTGANVPGAIIDDVSYLQQL